MSTAYQGIYTYKDAHGNIEAVQVEDSIGKGFYFPVDEYLRLQIEPAPETLPDQYSYLQ